MPPTDDDYMREIETLEKEKSTLQKQNQIMGGSASTIFGSPDQQNLIEWQLDIKKELIEIEHLLRGHIVERDAKGNENWVEQKDEDGALFNEKGVQEILKIIRMYLNKNTLLSNFDEKTIFLRLKQFAERLSRLIFMNYEDFGLDTEYKQKHYEMIVMNITDMVEAAYYRALKGGERDSLRTARTVNQTEPLMNQQYPQAPMQYQKRSMMNPLNWGRR